MPISPLFHALDGDNASLRPCWGTFVQTPYGKSIVLLTAAEHEHHLKEAGSGVYLRIENVQDPAEIDALQLHKAQGIVLDFPKFSDGRAFSQAALLRQRLNFKGDIRATGDVLIDQLEMMLRSGFSSAVLRTDQSLDHAKKQLLRYAKHYQPNCI